jgi:hypothetical protein
MISVEFDDRQIRAALDRLSAAAGNLRPALQDIGELLLHSHERPDTAAKLAAEQADQAEQQQ